MSTRWASRASVSAGWRIATLLGIWQAGWPSVHAEAPSNIQADRAQAILTETCARCHGELRKSDLDIRSLASLARGGKRGPAIVPGKPDESLIFRFVQPGSDPHMPPGDKQLSDADLTALKTWIAAVSLRDVEASEKAAAAPAPAAGSPATVAAPWLPPPGLSPALVIDLFLEKRWEELHLSPSPACDDALFVRRIYLDLAGRIPTRSERSTFLDDRRSSKREALVEALLAGDDYPRHFREVFDVVLLGRGNAGQLEAREKNGWNAYLESTFRDNRPWSSVVREVLLARASGEGDRGAFWFLYSRKNDAQAMAEGAAAALFGVQVGCAKCHNHPVAREILQGHYWGLVSFFSRSKNVDTEKGPAVAESAIGGFDRYTNLKGEAFDALLTFLDGTTVSEIRPADGVKEIDSPEKYVVPPEGVKGKQQLASVPRFSRREKLAETALEKSDRVARSFVNRVWALLLGRGLVHPVDKIDSAHPPSHPELLDWLARDFRDHGYDVRRLVRSIVLSRAYSLGARPMLDPAGNAPLPSAFAYALDRPIVAESLARTLLIATETSAAGGRIEALASTLREVFPDVLAEEPMTTLRQALFLTNNPAVEQLVTPTQGNLAARLLAIEDSSRRVVEAFLAVLGREPAADELSESNAFLAARVERPEAGVRQLLWALVSSAELFLNH